jgi:hypothetical protein
MEFGMAFIIRKDCPPGHNWPPSYVEKVFGLETYGRATAIQFVRDRDSAKRFENRQEAERIAETFVVGTCQLTVEPDLKGETEKRLKRK